MLAALPVPEKEQLAAWLAGRQLYASATYLFQVAGLRRGLHKLAKEGLVCLLESCAAHERRLVEAAATGGRPEQLWGMLRGWTLLSWRFAARARAVVALHAVRPDALAYLEPGAYGFKVYSREPVEGAPYTLQPTHTREKACLERAWRALRKSCCCLAAAAYNCALCWGTCGLWATCALPRLLRPCCGLWLPLALGFAVSVVTVTLLAVFLWQVSALAGAA